MTVFASEEIRSSPMDMTVVTAMGRIQTDENDKDNELSIGLKIPTANSDTISCKTDETASIVSVLSDQESRTANIDVGAVGSTSSTTRIQWWNKKDRYSDMIQSGLEYLNFPIDRQQIIMLYESPSSSNSDCTFFNGQVYRFHDYPPSCATAKSVLGPCRYSFMNGASHPVFLEGSSPPTGLVEHWETIVPGFQRPTFVSQITDKSMVYAYLPCESIQHHLNDPSIHYHLAGKDALPLMTKQTTKMLPNTSTQRPCIAKTTHSMGSKGIFVICNDEDEAEFQAFLRVSGNPSFVVTEFVEIDRNVACHFFIHPNGDVTFIGSNENHRDETGNWSMDSYLMMPEQESLRKMQEPFIKDVVEYCQGLGFWGFCGIDVLFDKDGRGYIVDLNPRVTGSSPALMLGTLLRDKYGFDYGLFRRNGKNIFQGPSDVLLNKVSDYNAKHVGESMVVLFSFYEQDNKQTKVSIGFYGHSIDHCKTMMESFELV